MSEQEYRINIDELLNSEFQVVAGPTETAEGSLITTKLAKNTGIVEVDVKFSNGGIFSSVFSKDDVSLIGSVLESDGAAAIHSVHYFGGDSVELQGQTHVDLRHTALDYRLKLNQISRA